MSIRWYELGVKRELPWEEPIEARNGKRPSRNPYEQAAGQLPKVVRFAHELMRSPVITLKPNSTYAQAHNLIKAHRFRHVPIVCPEKNKVIGLISDRDLLREAAAASENLLEWVQGGAASSRVVEEFMTSKILTANLDDEITEIARALFSERIGCMPILDKKEKLQGIITRSDILRMIMTAAPAHFWA